MTPGAGVSPPNFALLLGKRMDAKGGDKGSTPLAPPEGEAPDGDMSKQDSMETSALSAFMDASKTGDVAGAKDALKDFIELCTQGGYDNDGDEPDAAA